MNIIFYNTILQKNNNLQFWAVFSYKLRYIVGFWLVEMAISTNQKPTIYRNLYENTAPALTVIYQKPNGIVLSEIPVIFRKSTVFSHVYVL